MAELFRRIGWLSLVAFLIGNAAPLCAQETPTPPTNSQYFAKPETPPTPPAAPRNKYEINRDSLIYRSVDDDRPLRTSGENNAEYQAYNATVLKANQFTAEELEAAARRDVSFADLVRPVRQDYQFDLIYLEGRLVRLRQVEPEQHLKDAGIEVLYEGWMFPRDGLDPVCVLTTELPPGLEIATPPKDFVPAKMVRVAGYYFKLFWYESSEPDPNDPSRKRFRKAPLLMAKSFSLIPPPKPASDFWLGEFLPGMLLFLVTITAVLFTLNWYFRRGDRRLAAERTARYERENPFPGDDFTIRTRSEKERPEFDDSY